MKKSIVALLLSVAGSVAFAGTFTCPAPSQLPPTSTDAACQYKGASQSSTTCSAGSAAPAGFSLAFIQPLTGTYDLTQPGWFVSQVQFQISSSPTAIFCSYSKSSGSHWLVTGVFFFPPVPVSGNEVTLQTHWLSPPGSLAGSQCSPSSASSSSDCVVVSDHFAS